MTSYNEGKQHTRENAISLAIREGTSKPQYTTHTHKRDEVQIKHIKCGCRWGRLAALRPAAEIGNQGTPCETRETLELAHDPAVPLLRNLLKRNENICSC